MKFSDDQLKQLSSMFDLKLRPLKRTMSAIRKDLNWTMLKYDSRLVHLEKHVIHPPSRAAD